MGSVNMPQYNTHFLGWFSISVLFELVGRYIQFIGALQKRSYHFSNHDQLWSEGDMEAKCVHQPNVKGEKTEGEADPGGVNDWICNNDEGLFALINRFRSAQLEKYKETKYEAYDEEGQCHTVQFIPAV
ncbi:unnamed protein product [Protopolystoma xenopodis]|uniref:Uncharacterized protein n=1 Tax=Protopolystoma xenopodis TaxID=117903 RepID=A0A3S5FBM1_9PLAT|nr:unnamed protein product [Protopolystoma xenopodis]